ncbi:tetratricopeptide repeat protein, partial [Gemmatimonadota bacterium]
LLLFMAFWLLLGSSTLKLLRLQRDHDSFYLVLGAAAGIAGVLANSLLTFPLQTVTSALLIWTTSGLLLAACARVGSCLTVAIRIDPRQPLVALLLAVTVAVAGFGVWGAQRIVRSENLFFMALKQHAHDLKYSIRTNQRAAEMMPERFEMQYVEGWLGRLAGDTATARTYFERSVQIAPYFPPPYRFLGEYYFELGDFRRSETALRRYGEIYPRGIDGNYHLMIGRIAMIDTTRDRFAEVSEHLQASGNLQAGLFLAEQFLNRGMPDSVLTLLQSHRQRIRRNHNEYNRIYFLTAAAELARGDSTATRAVLDTLLYTGNRRIKKEGRYADYARQMQEMLK